MALGPGIQILQVLAGACQSRLDTRIRDDDPGWTAGERFGENADVVEMVQGHRIARPVAA